MQRFVKTIWLVDSPEAIAEYRRVHDEIWPEIKEGIKSVGISEMELYLLGNLAVMIMEVPDDVNVDKAMDCLSRLPRQEEWEAYVARFQQCNPTDTSAGKWKEMEQIFSLSSPLRSVN